MPQIELRYASESGTAEEAAEDTYHELLDLDYDVSVSALSINDLERWCHSKDAVTVIFFIATTGLGEWPIHARPFWQKLLQRTCPSLSHIHFSIYGFGDSAYTEFNFASRRLESRLLQLGAESFLRTGLGDDQHDFGYAQELDPWFQELCAILSDDFKVPHTENSTESPTDTSDDSIPIPDDALVDAATTHKKTLRDLAPHLRISYEEITPETHDNILEKPPTNAIVTENRRITSEDHFQAVNHVSLLFEEPKTPHWEPGDVCSIYPVVASEIVEEFLELQDLDGTTEIKIKPYELEQQEKGYSPSVSSTAKPDHFPWNQRVSLRTLFTYYLDLTQLPKGRWFFHVMAKFTEDEIRQEKLIEFGGRSLEAKDALFDYCKRPRRNIVDILRDFHTTKLPLQILLNLVPPMKPRLYSIANACHFPAPGENFALFRKHYVRSFHRCWDKLALDSRRPQVELCIAIVDFERGGRHIEGTCSRYVRDQLQTGSHIRAKIEKAATILPQALERHKIASLICISPGTGLTPVRALIQERNLKSQRLHPDMVFLGFRNKSKDYLYEDEWEKLKETQIMVNVAFSRDDKDKKIYVQDLIEKEGHAVVRALDNGAVLFISGRSHPMPQQVRSSLIEILQDVKGYDEAAAERYLAQLKKNQRYICDTWG